MINPRIFAFIALVGILIGIFYGGQFLFQKPKPYTPPIAESTTVYIKEYITVMVTPTPDRQTYFANEYQNGTRLLKRPFSWIRSNVTGDKDMKVTTLVYDYLFFDKLHWFNPATYKYQEMLPATPNSKFLLIFIYSFMDDIIGDDPRMWAFNRSFFAVQINDGVYRPVEYPYQLRFKELEETYTFNHDTAVQAFKSVRMYSAAPDYAKTAGEYSDEVYYLRGGRSNAMDGYLIFEVPYNTTPEDCLVLSNFYSFGFSQWRLRF